MILYKNSEIPYTKPKINKIQAKNKWQLLWNQNIYNKLYQIKSICKERKPDPSKTGSEETTLIWLFIGHTKLTHSSILKQKQSPKFSCGTPYTVKRILMACKNLSHTQRKFYSIKSMRELSCLNFWDEAWWFLSFKVFRLLSSSLLLYPQHFGRCVHLKKPGEHIIWNILNITIKMNEKNMRELFETIHPKNIINFPKKNGLKPNM